MNQLLTPNQVIDSGILPGQTLGNLAQLRYTGKGPAFVKLGRRVFYRATDIHAWIESNVRTSTAA